MNNSSKVVSIVAVVAGVLILGLALGWFGSRTKPGENPLPDTNSGTGFRQESAATPQSNKVALPPAGSERQKPIRRSVAATNAQAGFGVIGTAGTNGIPDWEDRVEDILIADTEDTDKVKKMVDMFPQLSAEGQEEVAHHLSNLTADEDYAPLSQFVTNSALSADVLDVFYEDVLNRPNAIKLPLLLQIAENAQHPNASDAHDVLELFLEEDYGQDWPKWQTAMEQWLKDNPD